MPSKVKNVAVKASPRSPKESHMLSQHSTENRRRNTHSSAVCVQHLQHPLANQRLRLAALHVVHRPLDQADLGRVAECYRAVVAQHPDLDTRVLGGVEVLWLRGVVVTDGGWGWVGCCQAKHVAQRYLQPLHTSQPPVVPPSRTTSTSSAGHRSGSRWSGPFGCRPLRSPCSC